MAVGVRPYDVMCFACGNFATLTPRKDRTVSQEFIEMARCTKCKRDKKRKVVQSQFPEAEKKPKRS